MPDLPISGLPAITVSSNSYLLAAVSASVTSKMTLSEVAAAISSSFTASQAISASYVISSSYAQSSTSASYSSTASYWLGSSNYTPTAYLSAFHTASMTNPVINTTNTMSFSVTDFAYGITMSGSYSDKIKITSAGIYNIQFSAQFDKTDSANSTAYIWLSKNGSNVAATNTGLTLGGGANDSAVAAWNFFVSASANDYFQLVWGATDTNTVISYDASPSVGPAVPSIILTVNRVG